jgi:myo-inositol 2-dehydrogenase/D-chiro-inositol 1-dehydrogenase
MRHFARCVRGKEEPQATGEDGRRVMQALYAGYASAGSGRRITLPYEVPAGTRRPIDLWLGPQAETRGTR